MELIKSKAISSVVPAIIAALLAAYFSTSAFAVCKNPEPPCPSHPTLEDDPADGVVTANGALLSSIMLADQGYRFEDGCIGASCTGKDDCCKWCLCVPILGRSTGICAGICCIFT